MVRNMSGEVVNRYTCYLTCHGTYYVWGSGKQVYLLFDMSWYVLYALFLVTRSFISDLIYRVRFVAVNLRNTALAPLRKYYDGVLHQYYHTILCNRADNIKLIISLLSYVYNIT